MESKIDGLKLACLTPRAGKGNHRFIIPNGSKLAEGDLLRLAGMARKPDQIGDDYICVGQIVQQLSGRDADEWLVVVGSSLKKLQEKDRQKIRHYLTTRVMELGNLVGQIDWESSPDKAAVPSNKLAGWEAEVNNVLQKGKTGIGKWLIGGSFMSSILILVILAIQFKTKPQSKKPEQNKSFNKTPVHLIADKLGWSGSTKTTETDYVLERILSLFNLAVQSELRKSVSLAETNGDSSKEHERLLLKAFTRLYQIINGENLQLPRTIEEFSSNSGFIKDIQNLFPNKQEKIFDPYGLVKDSPSLKLLQESIDPNKLAKFRLTYTGFANLSKFHSEIKRDSYLNTKSGYRKIVSALSDTKLKSPIKYGGQLFFCTCDIDYLKLLINFFEQDWFGDLSDNTNLSLGARIKLLKNEWPQGPDRIFSQDAINTFKNSPKFADCNIFFQSLEQALKDLAPFDMDISPD